MANLWTKHSSFIYHLFTHVRAWSLVYWQQRINHRDGTSSSTEYVAVRLTYTPETHCVLNSYYSPGRTTFIQNPNSHEHSWVSSSGSNIEKVPSSSTNYCRSPNRPTRDMFVVIQTHQTQHVYYTCILTCVVLFIYTSFIQALRFCTTLILSIFWNYVNRCFSRIVGRRITDCSSGFLIKMKKT